MSRTDELRQGGAQDRTGGGGGGAPFVKWGNDYAWIEGKLEKIWQTKFGDTALLTVSSASSRLPTKGKTEDGTIIEDYATEGKSANVGLNSSALEGRLTSQDEGENVHIAFEGWQEPKNIGGNRYRLFTVLVLSGRPGPDSVDIGDLPPDWVTAETVVEGGTVGEAGPGHPDADIPF